MILPADFVALKKGTSPANLALSPSGIRLIGPITKDSACYFSQPE